MSTNNRGAHPEKGPGKAKTYDYEATSTHVYASAYSIADRSRNEQKCRCMARMGAHARSSTSKLLIHKPNRLIEGHEANSNPIMAK